MIHNNYQKKIIRKHKVVINEITIRAKTTKQFAKPKTLSIVKNKFN